MPISREQYRQTCSVNLAEWLLQHHGSQVKKKYGSVYLLSDEHVSVKVGPHSHGYIDFRTNETGNAVKYLQEFLGYSYPDAVNALLGGMSVTEQYDDRCEEPTIHVDVESKPIVLPEPSDHCRNLFAYLTGRGIPQDVIRTLLKDEILYQSKTGNNLVFVNPERDYAEIRGTNTYADRRCKERDVCPHYTKGQHLWCTEMDKCSSYKGDPFHGCRKARPDRFWYFLPYGKNVEAVYVCESAIDAISLYIIHRRTGIRSPSAYVSIGGVANQRTIDRLKRHGNVIIAVDNDDAGDKCRKRNEELSSIVPQNKDWNEDLRKEMYR